MSQVDRDMSSLDRSVGAAEAEPRVASALPARMTVTSMLGPLIAAAVMLLLGVMLRAPTAQYDGPPDQGAFNNYIFQFLGAYSDVASLYFRDQLWNHPAPYFDYALEYPVGIGILIWLATVMSSSVASYLYITAAVMVVSGLLVIWLGRYFKDANLWLLALSPALALYVVLNWDLLSILLLVAALLLFRRDHDRWGALLLSAAVWTKFFPIVLLPLVLFDRALRRRWRGVAEISGIFGIASVLINAPFALQWTPDGLRLRDAWLFFFRFNRERGREVNVWNLFDRYNLSTEQINTYIAILLVLGVGTIMVLMAYTSMYGTGRARDLLLPASLAAIAWFFFINKVYSPQYSLWIIVLLALLAMPPALIVAFAAVDVLYFAASFIILHFAVSNNPATGWFFDYALFPAMIVREATILVIVLWALWRIIGRNSAAREETAGSI